MLFNAGYALETASSVPLCLRHDELGQFAGRYDGVPFLKEENVAHLRELLLRLGSGLARSNCQSCAVVGSAGSLAAQQAGADIDSHECVFRANIAPVHMYGDRVGTKHTFHVWALPAVTGLQGDVETLQKIQEELVHYALRAENASFLLLISEVSAAKALEFARSSKLPAGRVRVVHPMQLATLCRLFGPCDWRHRVPSTGLMMVHIARQICASPPSVFGFDANSIPFHYYGPQNDHVCDAVRQDRFRGQGGVHNWQAEQGLLLHWHAKRLIRLRLPSGNFSQIPDTSECSKTSELLEVHAPIAEMSGRYIAQVYGVNGKPVFERLPQNKHDVDIILYYTMCKWTARDIDVPMYTGFWVLGASQTLADEMKLTPGRATGCFAMAFSEDFRPERPEQSTWKVMDAQIARVADIRVHAIPSHQH